MDKQTSKQAKIYTSYYAKLGQLKKDNILPLAISISPPKWFSGTQIPELCPTYAMLKMSDQQYCPLFDKILLRLDPHTMAAKIQSAVEFAQRATNTQYDGVALLCYETTRDFCHRYMVAAWLNENGYDLTEFQQEDFNYRQNISCGMFSSASAPIEVAKQAPIVLPNGNQLTLL